MKTNGFIENPERKKRRKFRIGPCLIELLKPVKPVKSATSKILAHLPQRFLRC